MIASVVTGLFLELMILFAIVWIHELGHVVAAKGFGWRVKEVQLLPFGGVAVVDELGNIPAREEIVVALAGPLQNGIMIAFAALMQWFGWWDSEWGAYFIQANIMIGLFNLLPVLPLDGGKVMQAMLSMRMTYHRTIVYCAAISLLMSAFMIIMSLAHIYTTGVALNLLVIGIFLFYSNWYGYRNIPFHFIRFLMSRDVRVKQMVEKGVLAQPIVVNGKKSLAQIVRLFMKEKYHLIYVLSDNGIIQAIVPEQRILNTYFIENKPGSAVSDLFM